MYYLEHLSENRRVSCKSYNHAIEEYYRQWRETDGTIPWHVIYEEPETGYRMWIDPVTGIAYEDFS